MQFDLTDLIQKKLCNHVIYIINIEIHTKSPTALAHVKAY